MSVFEGLGSALTIALVAYAVVIQAVSTVLLILGWRAVSNYVRRRPLRSYGDVATSQLSMPVSILVPGYNEERTIVPSIKSLLDSQFLELEVVIVNDGSTDATLAEVISAFSMVPIQRVPSAGLQAEPVRAVYGSFEYPTVVLIDKANGGKSDALNVGINYARYPLVCAIDADTLLDRGALSRLVWEFQAEPSTVAVGGIVRVVNGSTFNQGRLEAVKTPASLLANLQIIEYLRAFLGARIGWSRLGMLLIISGAFGLFKRQALIDAGGYDRTTVGEDAELVLRLHRTHTLAGKPCRITFFPDPICWTEAPSTLRVLARQRDRWQRGLAEMLWRHKDMLLRRKYGRIGMIALPYFFLFELLAPVVEVFGMIFVVVGLIAGFVSVPLALLLLALSTIYGVVLSYLVILIEERAYLRYPGWRDLLRLCVAAIVENFGYRQLLALVRLRAFWTLWRRKGWGEMSRTGFSEGAIENASHGLSSGEVT